MTRATDAPTTIDEYLALVSDDKRAALQSVARESSDRRRAGCAGVKKRQDDRRSGKRACWSASAAAKHFDLRDSYAVEYVAR